MTAKRLAFALTQIVSIPLGVVIAYRAPSSITSR